MRVCVRAGGKGVGSKQQRGGWASESVREERRRGMSELAFPAAKGRGLSRRRERLQVRAGHSGLL